MKEKILQTKLLPGQIALFYIGQVGFIIKFRDKYIMIDGYLSDYVDRNCCRKGVTWGRRYPAPIRPEDLDFIDYVFCTHAHFDHMDPDTLSAVARVNTKAKFFASAAISNILGNYGIASDRINGLHCHVPEKLTDNITITAIPSAHEVLHPNDSGDYEEVGYRFQFGDTALFHGGDGCPYDGLETALTGCNILILPINGRDYYRTQVLDIIGCFDSREALTLAKNIGADLLIPTHFDLYDINCVNPSYFVDLQQKINPTQKYHIFMPGERVIYQK